MKGNGLKRLRELAWKDSWERHPSLPDYVRVIHNYTDKTANGLTRCILDFLRFSGNQGERISNTGRVLDNSRVVADVLGTQRRIGSMTWIPGTGAAGTADLSAIIKGISVKIEIKIGRDVMSAAQERYRDQVIRAGGQYWLCHNMDEFHTFYTKLIHTKNEQSISAR